MDFNSYGDLMPKKSWKINGQINRDDCLWDL